MKELAYLNWFVCCTVKILSTLFKILPSLHITRRVPSNLAVSTYLELCLSRIHPVTLTGHLLSLGDISFVAFLTAFVLFTAKPVLHLIFAKVCASQIAG